jgi:hypothetical protein
MRRRVKEWARIENGLNGYDSIVVIFANIYEYTTFSTSLSTKSIKTFTITINGQ